jgi:hypothetical protein
VNPRELFDTETMPYTSSILPRPWYRAAGVFIGVFLFASVAKPAMEDDTYAALDRATGPVIKIEGNQGYREFKLMTWEDGTIIDARGARWATFSWGVKSRHENPTPNLTTRNNYPIVLGADWGGKAWPHRIDLYNFGLCPAPQPNTLYWLGGVIEGTHPLDTTWHESKSANGAGITLNALNSTIDGMRIHNVHDPIVPLEGNNFTLRNSWISWSLDDAVENDGFAAGLIDDCLFDGFFVFYSARNTRPDSGRQAEAPGGGKGSVVRIQNCLIGAGGPYGPGTTREDIARGDPASLSIGQFWKQSDRDANGVDRNPTIELINNIFYIPRNFIGPRASRYDVMPRPAGRMEGNIIIWMGDGDYPFDYEGKGFTLLKGREGQEYWEKAKRDWIARHPKVPRVKGDPGYDPVIHGEVEPAPDGLPELIEDLIARHPPESRSWRLDSSPH